MKPFLTFITLYGLSFTFWGSVGLCRFFSEKKSNISAKASLLVLATIFSAALFSLVFLLSIKIFESIASILFESGEVSAVGLNVFFTLEFFFWLVVWGIFGSYRTARLFSTPSRTAHIVLFGSIYWLCGMYLGSIFELSPSLIQFNNTPLIWFVFSIVSTWTGTLLLVQFGGKEVDEINLSDIADANKVFLEDVAVLVPAHNEASSILDCLTALAKEVPKENIYVGSDGSTDATVKIVQGAGFNVADIQPNGGKARALKYLLDYFSIREHYKAILIMDADSEIQKYYLK